VRRLAGVSAWLCAAAVSACGGSGAAGANAAAGTAAETAGAESSAATETAAQRNQPPNWTNKPDAVAIGEGQTLELPLEMTDPEGDEVHVTLFTEHTGTVDAKVLLSPLRLRLRAGYGPPASVVIKLAYADGYNAEGKQGLTVAIKPLKWNLSVDWDANGPLAREHPAVWSEADSGRVHLFGGSGYKPYLQGYLDAWRYDAGQANWTMLKVAGDVPPPGGSRRAVALPGQKAAILFGGYGDGGGAQTNDLWRATWTGTDLLLNFQKLKQEPASPSQRPSPRALHVFAHDPQSQRFVVFGGAANQPLGDTWTMTLNSDTATWQQVQGPGPSPRYGAFAALEPQSGRLVVFGGAQGFAKIDPAQDVWELDVRGNPPTWSQLLAGGKAGEPIGRRNGCAVFDPTGPRLFVFGGTADGQTSEPGLWALDLRPGLAAWQKLTLPNEPLVRSSGAGVFVDKLGVALVGFGNTATAVYRDWTALGY
jgi:hypothetical protein